MLLPQVTLGSPVLSAAGRGFSVEDVLYAPNAEMAPHAHERLRAAPWRHLAAAALARSRRTDAVPRPRLPRAAPRRDRHDRGVALRVRRCVTQVQTILRDTLITSVNEIAKLVQRDPAYLCRAFGKQTGCTMGEYVRQLRMKKAAHLIASTDAPLADVAASCGFADQSHLTRVFKSQVGMAQAQFRAFARQSI
jgi:AraC-like DNA-binding protein